MTELDTAEIRAMIGTASHCSATLALELCDALDASRATIDGYVGMVKYGAMRARAEAAEARIAAALEIQRDMKGIVVTVEGAQAYHKLMGRALTD